MFQAKNVIRQHVKEMPKYEPILPFEVLSRQLGIPINEIIKLDANENPYGPLPEVFKALDELDVLHIYPDPENRFLREKIADYQRIPVENILAGAGADELIDLIMRLTLDPGDKVLNCPPTFGMYAFDAGLNAAELISIPRKFDFSINFKLVKETIKTQKPKLVILANPNNPDGGMVSKKQLINLLDLPALFILDEAYIEFAGEDASIIQEVTKRENLIVLRTFSKWAGLAGLRVGYGIFPTRLMPFLWKIKQPYNVSVVGSTAAIVSLEAADKLKSRCKAIVLERKRLIEELEQISWINTYASHANFVLCQVNGKDAKILKADLAKKGILVRYFEKPGLKDHIRISVGKPDQTDFLLENLYAFCRD